MNRHPKSQVLKNHSHYALNNNQNIDGDHALGEDEIFNNENIFENDLVKLSSQAG